MSPIGRERRKGREDRRQRDLQAWHDGELSWLGRRRVARRLARDPEARRELAALERLGRLLRDEDATRRGDPGELWESLRGRLPEAAPPPSPPVPSPRLRPAWAAAAGLALVAGALALAILLPQGHAPPATSLRWLRVDGQGAVVLEDDREATIIWVLPSPQPSRRTDGKLT